MMSKSKRWYRFFTSTDTYDPDRLNYDKELLRRFYLQKGYIDFEVIDTDVKEDKENESNKRGCFGNDCGRNEHGDDC